MSIIIFAVTMLLSLSSLLLHAYRFRGRDSGRSAGRRYLNRVFFDQNELLTNENGNVRAELLAGDPRFQHISQILKLHAGDTFRCGVLDVGLADEARIEFSTLPAKRAKGEELLVYNRSVAASVDLGNSAQLRKRVRSKVDLLLALPRPLRFEKLLPVIACMGVDNLVLLGAERVQKDYFGSHLLRDENDIRTLLIEGLSQGAVDYHMPRISIYKDLHKFLKSELLSRLVRGRILVGEDEMARQEKVLCLIAHPPDKDIDNAAVSENRLTKSVERLSTLLAQSHQQMWDRVVIAVGPEGGWIPNEVLSFLNYEHAPFVRYELGERILRTDMAVTALLSHAHEILAASTTYK